MESTGYVRFIVLTAGRTGSTWLTQALNSHPEIVCFGDVFKVSVGRVGFGVDGYDDFSAQDQALRKRDFKSFLQERIFCDHGPRVRAVGFKLEYSTVYEAAGLLEHLASDHEIQVIHLQRYNLLRAFISLRLTQETGRLHQQPLRVGWRRLMAALRHPGQAVERLRARAATRSYAPTGLTLTKEDCERFIRRVRWTQGHHNKLFADHERMDVLYEEMAREPQSIFGKVQQFLGVQAQPLSYSQQPLNVAPMRELLANYDELREAFRDTQYAWMFN